MNRTIIIFFIATIILILTLPAKAQEVARLKDIAITELQNTIDLNLQSNQQIPYNITNYMNGEIGIRFLNTTLTPNLKDNELLTVSQKDSINEARLIQDGTYTIELRLKGNDNLANKKIIVHNNVQKSNIILIEPVSDPNNISLLPINLDTQILPDFKEVGIDNSTKIQAQRNNIPEVKSPIAMYNEKTETPKPSKNDRFLAQTEPSTPQTDSNTDILDINDVNLGEALSAPGNSTVTNSTSSSVVPTDQTKDALDASDITEPDVSTAKSPSFLGGIWDFIVKYKWIFIGIAIVVVVFFVLIIGAVALMGSGRAPEGMMQSDEQIGLPGDIAGPIVDDEPVRYIPPAQNISPHTVSDAISQIISIRNKSGR